VTDNDSAPVRTVILTCPRCGGTFEIDEDQADPGTECESCTDLGDWSNCENCDEPTSKKDLSYDGLCRDCAEESNDACPTCDGRGMIAPDHRCPTCLGRP
jgi:DnaJ-class molecular chaperone